MAVPTRVREPFKEQNAGALAEAEAVRPRAERLAPAVWGQQPPAAEVDEGSRRRHHGHPTREGGHALPLAQRAHGQMQGDQRRGTRGVDGLGRSAQPQRAGDAS